MMEGYSLTIVGEEGLWLWFVDLNGYNTLGRSRFTRLSSGAKSDTNTRVC